MLEKFLKIFWRRFERGGIKEGKRGNKGRRYGRRFWELEGREKGKTCVGRIGVGNKTWGKSRFKGTISKIVTAENRKF